MARIRTIKPDFWEDEAVAALSPLARLLFIGSWNLADDEGLLRWTPDYLNASLLMYDGLTPARVKKLMDEIEALGMVFVYSAGKTRQTLAYVVNFRKHQRINRPQPSRLTPPSLQNPLTCEMYARRDNWTCHICKGPINAKKVPRYDGYDNDRIDWIRENLGEERLNFSPDHLIPRSKGGTDYPSNIGSSHVSCNKGRGNRPLPDSLNDSVNEPVNEDVPDSLLEGKGNGRGMEGEGKGTSVPSSSKPQSRAAPSSSDDDGESERTTLDLLVERRIALTERSTHQINNPIAYRARVAASVEAEIGYRARDLLAKGLSPGEVVDELLPLPRRKPSAAATPEPDPYAAIEPLKYTELEDGTVMIGRAAS